EKTAATIASIPHYLCVEPLPAQAVQIVNLPLLVKITRRAAGKIPDPIKQNAQSINIEEMLPLHLLQRPVALVFPHHPACIPKIEHILPRVEALPGVPVETLPERVHQGGQVVTQVRVIGVVEI